jgi:hypothetical protein
MPNRRLGRSALDPDRLLHYRLPGRYDRMFHDEGVALIAEHLRPVLDHVDAESCGIEDQLVKGTAALP